MRIELTHITVHTSLHQDFDLYPTCCRYLIKNHVPVGALMVEWCRNSATVPWNGVDVHTHLPETIPSWVVLYLHLLHKE